MHLSLSVTLALVAAASACYSGGQAWGDMVGRARELASEVCWEWDGLLFKDGENKYACKNLGGNIRVDFRMRNGGGDGGPNRILTYQPCIEAVNGQINNCNYGGQSDQGA